MAPPVLRHLGTHLSHVFNGLTNLLKAILTYISLEYYIKVLYDDKSWFVSSILAEIGKYSTEL